jgi:N-methylhydantoinase B
MASKMVGIKLKRGERLQLKTPGGGGWGEPAARQASARELDARMGYTLAATHATGNEK